MEDKVKKILSKYRHKLGEHLKTEGVASKAFSKEYKTFRREALTKTITRYERFCKFAARYLKLKVKNREKINDAIKTSHLNITPEDAAAFGAFFGFLVMLFGVLVGILLIVPNISKFTLGSLLFPLLIILAGVLAIGPVSKYPLRLASKMRLKASNQMVLCILYVVMYLRHTSNLEHAIKFAGSHISSPLNLDLRKVLWNAESGKFSTIKESLDHYLEQWRDYSLEFVEAFHLIESSLYARSEKRRLSLLDKSLEIMLQGTYDKMLHYAHGLKSPITMLYMLGVVLPILGLVIFPLAGSFMGGVIRWWHILILYNIILPVFVYYYGSNLLEKRPTGYGESEILELHPEFKRYERLEIGKYLFDPKVLAIIIFFVFFFIAVIPLLLHVAAPTDYIIGGNKFLDYKCAAGKCIGPYGLWPLILSLCLPLGIALSLALYYRWTTRKLIKLRKKTDRLEKEFSGALFQLGNRVGEGIPVELAFGRVAANMQGTPTGNFLTIVNVNIRKLGMSVKEAIFNKKRGAILFYPSGLIESSMKVLVQAARKGSSVVSKSLLSISDYVNRVHLINERLKDLLADIISSMKSQVTFLTPMIAGIVVAVASMIVAVINKLSMSFEAMDVPTETVGGIGGIMSILNIKDIIPPYYFQIVVGLFVIEIIIVLTYLAVSIERGYDKVTARHVLSKNLLIGVSLYIILTLIGVLIFNALAAGISTVTTAVA